MFYDSVPIDKPNDDEQIYSLKRVLAGSWGCRLGFDSCKKYAVAAFADYKKTTK